MNTYSTVYDEKLKIWSGIKKPILYSNKVSLGQIILTSLYRSPDAIGQICHDDLSTMSNGEIMRDSIRVSLNLQDMGLKQGDVIGIITRNHKNFASLVIGALLNGNTLSTIDPTCDFDYIYHSYYCTKPKVVICVEEKFSDVRAVFEKLEGVPKFFAFERDRDEFKWADVLLKPHPMEDLYTPPEIGDASKVPAIILSSSGTTGAPKNIPISHATMSYFGLQSFDIRAGYKSFTTSTMFWIGGWHTFLCTLYWNGTLIVTERKVDNELLMEVIRTHKINFLLCPPIRLAFFLNDKTLKPSDFNSIKVLLTGGTYLNQEVGTKMSTYLKNGYLSFIYAMTETTGLVCTSKIVKNICCGKLSPGTQLKIVDENGNHLGIGEKGEVCVRGPIPYLGYVGNEEETQNAYKNGWLHSGDIGFVDEDLDLHVIDRKRFVMRLTKGVNKYQIFPSEIESVILEIEDIVMVAVVGIPDPSYNELPTAMVVKQEGSSITEHQIMDHVKSKLPDYKWLRGGVFFTDKLRFPLTISGKTKKKEVKATLIRYHKIDKTG